MNKSEQTKEFIIEKLEEIVMRIGIANFTLEEVAKEAGISKGGLLYHFPSKKALLFELINSIADKKFKERNKIAETLPDTPARLLKAHILVWMNDVTSKRKLFPAVLTTLSHYPEMLDDLKERYFEAIDDYLKAGLDPVMVNIILLVLDGFLFQDSIAQERDKIFLADADAITEKLFKMAEESFKK